MVTEPYRKISATSQPYWLLRIGADHSNPWHFSIFARHKMMKISVPVNANNNVNRTLIRLVQHALYRVIEIIQPV
jgi:hypothetical protein